MRSIQVGPFTLQVLSVKRRLPPNTDTPRDQYDAEQTSAAQLDPEQPQAVGRAGQQGYHCGTPGPRLLRGQ